ncbi:MAG: transaldolase [Nitrospiraceae bacterium]
MTSHVSDTTQVTPLFQLAACGQSYWLDNLSRRMIRSGELTRRVSEEGLRGITSNPTTFHTAITGSADYDRQIEELARAGVTTKDLFEALMVSDVQEACDLLRPVYESSDRLDGYVSLEVSPHFAHDAHRTMDHARRLFGLVSRPNVTIKIPGTPAGVPAIEEMLYEGLNINITLLFSIQNYQAVAEAYLRALERRVGDNARIDGIASVASFFVSRVDTLIDQLLGHRMDGDDRSKGTIPAQLLGRAAVANARVAYKYFKQIFAGERWTKLVKQGARVQRVLWASTGRKNPSYSDVGYVEPLVGRETVNTMPEATIRAFADHGRVVADSVEADVEESLEALRQLENVGIDYRCVTWQLENEGIQKFIDSYDACIQAIDKKRKPG